jgi:hypothetical protein
MSKVGTKRSLPDSTTSVTKHSRTTSNSSSSSNSNSNGNGNNSGNNGNNNMTSVPNWGEWMGSWKVGSQIDQEAERIDRQKAAFGGDTISRLKDLNVLILGCKGVGVETAKNLILSNGK